METTDQQLEVTDYRIFKADNNLDKKDNLGEIPSEPAVYAIFGRINGAPVNCRFVGESDNLQEAIRGHFEDFEKDACLKQFMQSIKIKTINYQLMQGSSEEDRKKLLTEWEARLKPECNDELNKVH